MNVVLLAQVLKDVAVLAMWLALPVVVAIAVAGAIASLLRVVTQLQDSAVALLARLAGFSIAMVIFAPSIAHQVAAFGNRVMALIGSA
jgi:type III secretory pathway component EscS